MNVELNAAETLSHVGHMANGIIIQLCMAIVDMVPKALIGI